MLLALALASLGGTPVGTATRTTPAPFRPPNVIVIVLDDVGIDQLGMYGLTPAWGEKQANTPVLDYLRGCGVLFQRVWGAPLCSPSRAMLLTGRHGFRTGMLSLSESSGPCPPGTVFSGPNACCPANDPQCSQAGNTPVPPLFPTGYSLPESEITLAEALRDAAYPAPTQYARGAFGKWHLAAGADASCHPVRQGFEIFQGFLYNNDGPTLDHYDWLRTEARTTPGGCVSSSAPVTGEWDAERNAIDARAWIDGVLAEPSPRPFFAYVCFNPPHRPFQVPPQPLVSTESWGKLQAAGLAHEGLEVDGVRSCQAGTVQQLDGRAARLVYRASLESVDAVIGRLVFKSPGQPELLDNTLVFVIGDNGTPDQIYEATQDSKEVGVNAAPYTPNHAKFQIYELGIRVPLLVAGPGVAQGGTCATFVSSVDLWSTIVERAHADVTGLLAPEQLDSRSFAARLRRPAGPLPTPERTELYAETAARNAMYYDRGTATWSPYAPPASVRYQRAILDQSGFKYLRRVLGSNPGCTGDIPFCNQPPGEEIFRLFDSGGSVDAFESLSRCGDPAADAELAILRARMSSNFSGN